MITKTDLQSICTLSGDVDMMKDDALARLVLVVGPNGSGKSTVLGHIARLDEQRPVVELPWPSIEGDGDSRVQLIRAHLAAAREGSTVCMDDVELHLDREGITQMIAEVIQTVRTKNLQVFMATHSLDVVDEALLQTPSQDLMVLRLRRDRARTLSEGHLIDYNTAYELRCHLGIDVRGRREAPRPGRAGVPKVLLLKTPTSAEQAREEAAWWKRWYNRWSGFEQRAGEVTKSMINSGDPKARQRGYYIQMRALAWRRYCGDNMHALQAADVLLGVGQSRRQR